MSNEEKDLETPCPYHSQEKYGQCDNPQTISTYCVNNKDCFYKLYAIKVEEQSNKCKKVLSEIKEVVESVTDCGSLCKICEISKNCADCLDDKMLEILQKINEVEGE